ARAVIVGPVDVPWTACPVTGRGARAADVARAVPTFAEVAGVLDFLDGEDFADVAGAAAGALDAAGVPTGATVTGRTGAGVTTGFGVGGGASSFVIVPLPRPSPTDPWLSVTLIQKNSSRTATDRSATGA